MGTRAELDWLLANGMGWLVDSMGGPEAFLSPEPTPTPTSTSQSTSTALPSGPTAEELAKAEADRIAAEQAAEAAYYEEERRRLEAEEAARRAQNAAIEEDERQAEIRRLQETQTTYYQPVQEQEPVYSGTTYYYASNGAAFTSPAERDGYESNLQAIYAAQEAAARAAQETAARAAQEEAAVKAAQEAAANLAAQEAAKKAAEEAAAKKAAEEAAAKIVSSQTTSSGTSIGTGQTMALIDDFKAQAQKRLAEGYTAETLAEYARTTLGLDDAAINYALGISSVRPGDAATNQDIRDAIKAEQVAAGTYIPTATELAANALATRTGDDPARVLALLKSGVTAEQYLATNATEQANIEFAKGEQQAQINYENMLREAASAAAGGASTTGPNLGGLGSFIDPIAYVLPTDIAPITAEDIAKRYNAQLDVSKFTPTTYGVEPLMTSAEYDARIAAAAKPSTGTNIRTIPLSTGLSGLSALANTTQTQTQTQNQGTQQPPPGRVDFSKLPPQLRMAGQYADYLAMPTADKGPKLSTYRKVGDATATGLAGAMPTYTMGRAPTSEEAFRNFIYAGGASDALASERALQYARNMGLTPEQTLSLTNRTLNTNFGLPDYDAAVAAGRGLLAIPEARTAPALSYASPGFTAPSQGGLSAAAAQGMSKETFYGNINAALQNNLLGPQQVADAMRTYGITADDLIAARAMANTPTTGAATSSTTLPASATVTSREGGPIAFAEGDVVKAPVMAGEKAYTLADFGITPATVETARGLGAFTVPRNFLFNPELIKREAAYRKEKGLAGGGDVGRGLGSIAMKGYAQEMAQKGRFGDTMLAHISPEEAQMLQAAGGAGTINPQTGLPEFFSWRKTLKGIAKVAPFIVPFIPGVGLAAKALISGIAGGLGGEKGFDFKRGLMSGLMSYGIGSAAQNLGLTSGAAPTGAEAVAPQAAIDTARAVTDPNVMGGSAMFQAPQGYGTSMMDFPSTRLFEASSTVPSEFAKLQIPPAQMGDAMVAERMAPPVTEPSALDTIKAKISPSLEKAQTVLDKPIDTLYAVPMAVSSAAMVSEGDKYAQAVAAQKAEEERKKRLGLDLFRRSNFAGGGDIAAMVAGGATGPANEPRTINGAGDGMSDSVPATIEGVQEARLADGEFVIPADVVADLGNGSSNAGSKKLYAMMDRVRKARHGTTRQPPEVDTGRLMPA